MHTTDDDNDDDWFGPPAARRAERTSPAARWAAVVYGRTYQADFRFLETPVDFTRADRDWLADHVLGALGTPEHLRLGPRWCLARNGQHCLVGVACTADDLLGRAAGAADDARLTRDRHGRPLYVFVGLVARATSNGRFPRLPALAELDLAGFRDLYEPVRAQWLDLGQPSPRPAPYERSLPADPDQPVAERALADPDPLGAERAPAEPADVQLNTRPAWVLVWPETAAARASLWSAAAHSSAPVSLCLGLTRQKDALEGPFLNATVAAITEPAVLQRTSTDVGGEPTAGDEQIGGAASSETLDKLIERGKGGLDLAVRGLAAASRAARRWHSPPPAEPAGESAPEANPAAAEPEPASAATPPETAVVSDQATRPDADDVPRSWF